MPSPPASTAPSPTTSSPRGHRRAVRRYKRTAFVEPGATPVAFSMDLAEKDMRLTLDLADARRIDGTGEVNLAAVGERLPARRRP